MHDGDFAHLSTPVEAIRAPPPPADGGAAPPETPKRVILGFNLFTSRVGACCARAPEHSDAFNATIKLYQTSAALVGGAVDTKYSRDGDGDGAGAGAAAARARAARAPKQPLTLDAVKANKPLAKMLVLLARKAKENEAGGAEAAVDDAEAERRRALFAEARDVIVTSL